MPRIRPTPLTKRLIKRARISKPQPLRNLGKTDLRLRQPHNRQLLAHTVLEPLIRLPFFRQTAAQGGGGDAQAGGEAFGFRPGVGGQLAQVVLDAGGEAVGVAVFDQDVGGRVGQEAF